MDRFFNSLAKLHRIESKKRITSARRMAKSVVSLVFATVVLATSTYCWFAVKSADAKTDHDGAGISLKTAKGLRVNDVSESLEKICDDSYLLPASSVDGRNLYFPTDGTDFSSQTDSMTFRSANTGDKNYSYLQYDFSMTAEENDTNIYIKTKDRDGTDTSYIYFHDEKGLPASQRVKSKAIRAAIYYEGMEDNKPIVFNGTNQSVSTDAVETIDRTDGGCLSRATQLSVPFKDYMYGKRILATLDKGETRTFSLIIWIEGTIDECTNIDDNQTNDIDESLVHKQIDMAIDFTTSWDQPAVITFEDENAECGIQQLLQDNPRYSLVLNYSNSAKKISDYQFTMYRNGDNKWQVSIPDNAVNDIEFRIINTSTGNTVTSTVGGATQTYVWKYNKYGNSTLNRMTSTTYIAEGYKTKDGSLQGYGHWYDGEIENGGYGRDDDDNPGINDDDWL